MIADHVDDEIGASVVDAPQLLGGSGAALAHYRSV
jgi:hypothetical protein